MKIEPDISFLSWVASKTNGANVHDSNLLRNNYTYYCRQEDVVMAEKTKTLLTRFINSGVGSLRLLNLTNQILAQTALCPSSTSAVKSHEA